MNAVHVSPRDDALVSRLCALAFPGWRGQKVQLRPVERVQLHGMFWDGGSRSQYVAIDLETLRVCDIGAVAPRSKNPPQFGGPVEAPVIPFSGANANLAVVEHVIFCGRDMGLRIYASPARLTPLLPASADLSADERVVLDVTCGLKSSYRLEEAQRRGLTRARYDAAKATLIAGGYLNAAGAATNKGRNAR